MLSKTAWGGSTLSMRFDKSLSVQLTAAVDLTDILRAEIVMVVSAFDYYIHELCRLGIIESYKGNRTQTDALSRFQIPMSALANLSNAATAEQTLDAIIREKHGYLSFQKPDSIADAIRMFSTVQLWNAVAAECGETAQTAKSAFQLIIDRRNQIAHEAVFLIRPTLTNDGQ